KGHSGSPFRQAMEHPTQPLRDGCYACLGVQPAATSQPHLKECLSKGDIIRSATSVRGRLPNLVNRLAQKLGRVSGRVYLSLDTDVVRACEVPGVSAPNALGLSGWEVAQVIRLAGSLTQIESFDLVEINPDFDIDGRSARWAAVCVWQFL